MWRTLSFETVCRTPTAGLTGDVQSDGPARLSLRNSAGEM